MHLQNTNILTLMCLMMFKHFLDSLNTMKYCRVCMLGNFEKKNVKVVNSYTNFKNLRYGYATQLSDTNFEELLTSDEDYQEIAKSCFDLKEIHNCFIIQPYVKWGPKKLAVSPVEQLEEAVALIKSLPSWKVEGSVIIPLETLEKKKMFGSGNMEKLSKMIKENGNITAVFISKSNLRKSTSTILEDHFCKPVLDRYKIVIQILKMHAISKQAKLQVALAELYFIQEKAQQLSLFPTHDPEKLKLVFHKREKLLKNALLEIRNHRKLLKNKRQILDYPVIAVVGYTNSGKTSLIKALTGEKKLQPKNQLFATLDVTFHEGILPSGLKILLVDTVGFLSDLPTNLLECFVTTLEDALSADIILHVEDLSSTCFDYKRDHVLRTIQELSDDRAENIMSKVMSVGNKLDIKNNKIKVTDILEVSAKNGIGLEALRIELEKNILKSTSRQKVTIRIPNGGDEIRWLYKNSTVISECEDPKNNQMALAKIIITNVNLSKFRHYFIEN